MPCSQLKKKTIKKTVQIQLTGNLNLSARSHDKISYTRQWNNTQSFKYFNLTKSPNIRDVEFLIVALIRLFVRPATLTLMANIEAISIMSHQVLSAFRSDFIINLYPLILSNKKLANFMYLDNYPRRYI